MYFYRTILIKNTTLISKLIPAICACFLYFSSFGQLQPEKYHINTSFEILHSTHSTQFPGLSVEFEKDFSRFFTAGLGVGYSHGTYHDDNGWDLYNLNFTPVYLTQRLNFLKSGKLVSYLRLSEGVSFIQYYKQPQNSTSFRQRVKESGFYGYAALGAQYHFTPKFGMLLETGIKSFHISTNNLDVNPHGVAFKIGAVYNF